MHASGVGRAVKPIRHYRIPDYLQTEQKQNTEMDPIVLMQECKTEYRLDFVLVTQASPVCAVVLTKWMCLGDERSTTQGPCDHFRSDLYESVRLMQSTAGSITKGSR